MTLKNYKLRPWCLGNTTVRSPFRLRDGLIALSNSSLQGNLHGEKQEKAFRDLLGDYKIVELGKDPTYSVGRKWRSALNKMGFLTPDIKTLSKSKVKAVENLWQSDIGFPYMITHNGWRLIKADTIPAIQECFLRSLYAYRIPSLLEEKFNFQQFSPLKYTLTIMAELEKIIGDSSINFIEMAVIVQLTTSQNIISDVIKDILMLRQERKLASNKRAFDREKREIVAKQYHYVSGTFNDYADTNIRYLKATGLVKSNGRGISFVPEQRAFIEKIVLENKKPHLEIDYIKTLCHGAELPTDNKKIALDVLEDLKNQLRRRNLSLDIDNEKLDTAADIAIIRHKIEEILSRNNEEEYARKQKTKWPEIIGYMDLLISRKSKKKLTNNIEIEIPKAEAPSYFEWTLWRAFLAINSLVNKAYNARGFKIDQDFLPVGTAPGNRPDLIFEFKDFILIVEVTLMTNSRQEAAEGESVRRHVANLVQKYDKAVYGLFIANKIDSNTAETFRIGIWYLSDDKKMRLDIIPITLLQFKLFFEAMFTSDNVNAHYILNLLNKCSDVRQSHEAPSWKKEIESIFNDNIKDIYSSKAK